MQYVAFGNKRGRFILLMSISSLIDDYGALFLLTLTGHVCFIIKRGIDFMGLF